MIEYKSYGYIRTLFYTLGFIGGAFGWGLFFLLVTRFMPFLRLLGRFLWLDLALILATGFLTAFWLVNYFLIIPNQIFVSNAGFISRTSNTSTSSNSSRRKERELFARWTELDTVQNILVGTYVTVRANNGRYYRFIFPLDTDGYSSLIDSVRSAFNEQQYQRQREN